MTEPQAFDPDRGLDDVRELISDWSVSNAGRRDELAEQIIELVEQMDNWLTGGGPLPADWTRMRNILAGHRRVICNGFGGV